MLRSIILYARNVSKAASFYSEGLGMRVTRTTAAPLVSSRYEHPPEWTEAVLETPDSIPLVIHHMHHEAFYSTGCSPLLVFRVEEMENMIPKLLMRGAFMDGKIHYDIQGKMVRLRSPDGHMIALYEMTMNAAPPLDPSSSPPLQA
jgi:catechol 2,3-dioxygenase-like lactoylglutathione lyase family enzyme